jgi:hypothetical protein
MIFFKEGVQAELQFLSTQSKEKDDELAKLEAAYQRNKKKAACRKDELANLQMKAALTNQQLAVQLALNADLSIRIVNMECKIREHAQVSVELESIICKNRDTTNQLEAYMTMAHEGEVLFTVVANKLTTLKLLGSEYEQCGDSSEKLMEWVENYPDHIQFDQRSEQEDRQFQQDKDP